MIPVINYVALKSVSKGGVYPRHDRIKAKLEKHLLTAQTDTRKLSVARRMVINSQFRNISNWVSSQGSVPLRELSVPSLNEINAYILKLKQN